MLKAKRTRAVSYTHLLKQIGLALHLHTERRFAQRFVLNERIFKLPGRNAARLELAVLRAAGETRRRNDGDVVARREHQILHAAVVQQLIGFAAKMPDVGLRLAGGGQHERVGRGLRFRRRSLPRRQFGGKGFRLSLAAQRQIDRRAADGQFRLRRVGRCV